MAKIGGITGDEPVAITALPKASFSVLPSGLVSSRVLESRKRARAWISFTPRILHNSATPPVSLPTTDDLNERSRSRSTFGLAKVTPHWVASSASWIRAATCNRAFDGMQPRCRQTPPGIASSLTSVTSIAAIGRVEGRRITSRPSANDDNLCTPSAMDQSFLVNVDSAIQRKARMTNHE